MVESECHVRGYRAMCVIASARTERVRIRVASGFGERDVLWFERS